MAFLSLAYKGHPLGVTTLRRNHAMNVHVHWCLILVSTLLVLASCRLDKKVRADLAQAHFQRVYQKVLCHEPLPRVVQVTLEGRKVVPPATVLHRCGDSSGCCDDPLLHCVAKRKEKLKLFFFVKPLTSGAPGRRKKQRVKKLTFFNHTECHCVDKRHIPR